VRLLRSYLRLRKGPVGAGWRCSSLAGELEVERTEPDSEGLEEGAGESTVHVEALLAHAPELHVDVVVIVLVD